MPSIMEMELWHDAILTFASTINSRPALSV